MDTAFERVIRECAQVRLEINEGTWINGDMIKAYCGLHAAGFAHSVEAWHGDMLAGGLYGVSLGRCFFGESMFTRVSNASKVALVALAKHLSRLSFDMIDCQVDTEHMIRFGATAISRDSFLKQLKQSLAAPTIRGKWTLSP
jgi:leucyl/phenylalanyl-tRNA--protein transferase